MFLVFCSDCKSISIDMFSENGEDFSDTIFGPFENKYDAEEWVDNNCGKAYFSILKINTV